MLDDLQLGEFIYEQPAVGDAEYTFKHALTQEVAYNSVLIERRKHLHERIGAALETLYAESARRSSGRTRASLRPQRQRRARRSSILSARGAAGGAALGLHRSARVARARRSSCCRRCPTTAGARCSGSFDFRIALGAALMTVEGLGCAGNRASLPSRARARAQTRAMTRAAFLLTPAVVSVDHYCQRPVTAGGTKWRVRLLELHRAHHEPAFIAGREHTRRSDAVHAGATAAAQRNISSRR